MIDYLGQKLNINDEVVFPDTRYKALRRGKILHLGDAKVTIKYIDGVDLRFPDKMGWGKTMRFYEQVVKVPIDYDDILASPEALQASVDSERK